MFLAPSKIIARWAFNVQDWNPSEEQYKKALLCIQSEERVRIEKFKFFIDSKLALVGRLLMRFLFNKLYKIPWNEIKFGRTKENKPILIKPESNPNDPIINFNISHHGDWVVLVAAENCRIGIDVMKVEYPKKQTVQEFFETLRDQFSNFEWNIITKPLQEIDQLHQFYRYWCLKESYVKAVGIGLALDLKTIEFHLPENDERMNISENVKTLKTKTKLYINNEFEYQWKFEELYLDNLHCVAISYSTLGDVDTIEGGGFEKINIEEILNSDIVL
ncbi:18094_t:CDS:2 [Gigaspora margarita]|uniref:L-aminoadipate-semialdehyde dehydrogenase-phosphopantetheinyl transferase n=2 Tax=Gigaspora margarita TaxID=4874 RepID=A0A8H3XB20_GIGMA|nr:L-aminoadipate-semialdehyde dehydrogenase-phosphopantetheinyl transferase [Gigaspora margarita]CAG8532335.1 18094_t:CDS:2 [Gigaspora margarita]